MKLEGRRILVVDDDDAVRFITSEEFIAEGCAVREASDGFEGLDVLQGDELYDLLVTDVRMPGLDGWTLAEKARSLRPNLPVLFITGWSDVEPRPIDRSHILSKPYRMAELVATAARLID